MKVNYCKIGGSLGNGQVMSTTLAEKLISEVKSKGRVYGELGQPKQSNNEPHSVFMKRCYGVRKPVVVVTDLELVGDTLVIEYRPVEGYILPDEPIFKYRCTVLSVVEGYDLDTLKLIAFDICPKQ